MWTSGMNGSLSSLDATDGFRLIVNGAENEKTHERLAGAFVRQRSKMD